MNTAWFLLFWGALENNRNENREGERIREDLGRRIGTELGNTREEKMRIRKRKEK
jgi:hypothetical protein